MKKFFSIFIFAFLGFSLLSSAVPTSVYGGSATLVAGLVSRAKVLPVGGSSADEIATASIISTFKQAGIERFTELCGSRDRLRARIKARINTLNSQLCNGARSMADDCFYTSLICNDLQENGCSTSASQVLERCVERATRQGGETLSNLPTLEAAVAGRCEQACSDGIDVNGIVLSQAARAKCSESGFGCTTISGATKCALQSEAEEAANAPITIEMPDGELILGQPFEELPLEEQPFDESAFIESQENGTLNDTIEPPEIIGAELPDANFTCSALGSTTCPTGQALRTSADANGCMINQCVTVSTLPAPASCSETDGGNNRSVKGTMTVISNSVSKIYSDSCSSATSLTEYYCSGTSFKKAVVTCNYCVNGACVTAASDTPASDAPASVTYTCIDSDKGQSAGSAGTVTVTPSTGKNVVSSDSCADTSNVEEFYCVSSTSSAATLAKLACPSGQSCSNGACTTSASITGNLIAPLTVKIIAIPSLITAFQVSSEVNDEVPVENSPSCVANCKGIIRAEVCGSYSSDNINRECGREAVANAGLIAKFCSNNDAASAFNECSDYVESTCGLAQPAFDKCQEMLTDEGAVVDLLVKLVESRCDAISQGLETDEGFEWVSQLPYSSGVIAEGTAEQVTQSKVTIEKSLRNNVIDETQRLVCLRYSAEREQAAKCKQAVESIKQSVQRIQQLREQLDDTGKESVDRSLDALNIGLVENQRACELKEKNAGGICSSILGG